jgi:hypothetical protein
MDILTDHYGYISGWVSDSYIMASSKEMPLYNKNDFEVLSLDIIRDLQFYTYDERGMVERLGQNYLDEHKRKSRKLTEYDIPRDLMPSNTWEKLFDSIYYINIKAGDSYDTAHRHVWDLDTLHNCFEYLRENISGKEYVAMVPYEYYQNIYFIGHGGFVDYTKIARIVDINLSEYNTDIEATKVLFNKYFEDMHASIFVQPYMFYIRNEKR